MEETEQAPIPTTQSVGVRYGVIYGAIAIVYFLIFAVSGMNMSGAAQWGSSAIAIVVVVLAHKYFKDNGDGFMSYSQGLGIGALIGAVSAAMSRIFTYIYIKFIDASFIQHARDKAIEDMQNKGQSDEQIEMGMKFVEMFTSPEAMLGLGLFFGVLILVIIALVVSIFTQKAKPEQF